jgi:VCBS repeat-containing protein
LNFAGKFEFSQFGADANPGAAIDMQAKGDGLTGHGQHAIVVPDAHLLFSGDYRRAGSDLVLSKDGHDHVVHDYFKNHTRATLASPDGAQLSGALVDALTGEVQVAQLGGGTAAAIVIGRVTKLSGSATAIRNGVSIQLNMGDTVNKGDVVQAGSDSSLGLTFIDGTVFGLSSNARMVLNEMIYDPNGSSNSSLLSLVQGTITFVAGETAKHGDMRVDTPVATMGIRGTAVLVEIDFSVPGTGGAPPVKFQVLVEPGGKVGSYVLYSKSDPTLAIGTVNQAGQVTSVGGDGSSSTTTAPLSPEALALIPQIFQLYFPNYVPNANPQSTNPNGGSTPATPTPGSTNPDPIKFTPAPDLPVGVPTTIPVNLPGDTGTSPINVTITRFNTAPTFVVTPVAVTLPVDNTSFKLGDQVKITDPDIGDGNFNDIAVPYVAGTGKVVSATGPAQGPSGADLTKLVTVDPQTGHVSYDPAAFKFLPAGSSAVFTITFDSQSGPDTVHETLTFTVDGTNDAPVVAAPLTAATQQGDAPFTADLLHGASDPDVGETAALAIANVHYKIGSGPVSATAPPGISLTGDTLNVDPADPAFAYLAAGQVLAIVVTYDVTDAHGATVAQTETITITGTNDAPVVTGTSIEVAPGGIVVLGDSSFTVVDPDSTGFTFTVSNVTGGTFQVWDGENWVPSLESSGLAFRSLAVSSPSVTFTSADLHDGHVRFVSDGSTPSPTFSVQADDGGASNSSSAVFVATVEPGVNHAPQTGAVMLASLAEDSPRTLTEAELLAQATDADGQTLHVQNLRIASGGGTLCDNGDGTWTYTPKGNYSGPVKFNYDVSDGITSVANTASLAVTPVNDAPVIVAAPLLVPEGGTVVLNAFNFIVYDPDSSSFTFTVSDVTHGTFQLKTGGTWVSATSFTTADINAGHVRFVHDGGEVAPTFSVQADDGASANNLSNTVHGPVIYIPVNDAPVITSASFAVDEGGTVVLHRSDFGVSDPDSSNFKFTVSGVTHGHFQTYSHGQWSNDNTFTSAELDNGLVRFVHDGSEVAPAFSIKADDGAFYNHVSGTVAGTVALTEINHAPVVAAALTAVAHEGDAPFSGNLLDGASDPDTGETATLAVINVTYKIDNGDASATAPDGVSLTGATLSIDPRNAVFDHLAEGETTKIVVSYNVADSHGATVSQTETVTIIGTNDSSTIDAGSVTSASIGVAVSGSTSSMLTPGAEAILAAGSGLVSDIGGGAGYGNLALPAGDDNSSGAIDITSVFGADGVNFFGTHYTSLYVNNNGNITFGSPSGTYTPLTIDAGLNNPIIAAFWADVDTRGHGAVYYDLDSIDGVMTITWDNVGYFSYGTDRLNSFQILLVNEGGGNFDIVYRYAEINWTAGSASGGYGGLGGTPARAGYSAGDGAHYYELPQSGDQAALLSLPDTPGNTGVAGVDGFQVHDGDVGPSIVTTSGAINFADADLSDIHTAHVDYTGLELGTLTLTKITDSTGTGTNGQFAWTYTADAAAVRNALLNDVDGTRVETFDVVIDDGHGGTITQTVSVTLTETGNHPPLISTSHLETFASDQPGATLVTGISVSDVDSAAGGFTIAATALHGSLTDGDGHALPTSFVSLTALNSFLGNGVVYAPSESQHPDDRISLVVTDAQGASDTVNFVFNVSGTGPVSLTGSAGKDVILATGYQDTLTGGGGNDQFVFGAGSGHDTITDFTPGQDHIDLAAFLATNDVAQWMTSHVAQSGADTLITTGENDVITLHNVMASSLHAGDFIVHPYQV